MVSAREKRNSRWNASSSYGRSSLQSYGPTAPAAPRTAMASSPRRWCQPPQRSLATLGAAGSPPPRVRSAFQRMVRSSAHWRTIRSRRRGSMVPPSAPLSARRMTRSNSASNPICWARVETPRSAASRSMATRQPLPSPPTRWSGSARAPSKKTSLNSLVPVSCRIGRTSTLPPGWSIGTRRRERPWWRCEPDSVRASTKHQSASWAYEVQIFWPERRYAPVESRVALVRTAARSEPAPGSL